MSYYLLLLVHGQWNWVDLTAYNYKNWNDGEPNANDDLRYCAQVYKDSGHWDDTQCTQLKGYICKRRRSKILNALLYTKLISYKIIFPSSLVFSSLLVFLYIKNRVVQKHVTFISNKF